MGTDACNLSLALCCRLVFPSVIIMGGGGEIISRTTGLQTPGSGAIGIVCGIVNLILFGIGTIIAGAVESNVADIIIGVLQLLIPFVGWIWSVVWGILMIIRSI